MSEGIKGKATVQTRGIIAKIIGRPGMGKLMDGKRGEQDDHIRNQGRGV
jgi:hypothetical protein